MPDIFIRLHKKSQNVLLQSILGSYSHLMWVRTEDQKNAIVRVATTDDLYQETARVLEGIRSQVSYDIVKIDK